MNLLTENTLYRDAADVQRYHTKRIIRNQTVGQHTFNMLMLLNQVHPDCSKEMLQAVMHHDLPELMTGDIPAPIKKMHDTLGPLMDSIEEGLAPLYREVTLTPWEETLLKWVDRMELVLWCLEEVRMGNTYCRETAERGLMWILESRKQPLDTVAECDKAHLMTMEVVDEFVKLGLTVMTRPLNEREHRA